MKKIFRLGTRGSPLALIQAEMVRQAMLRRHPKLENEGWEVEIVPLRTAGDWRPGQKEQTFLDMGGNKGLFTKEIEDALLAGMIDGAVHSMKDVPASGPDGLAFAAIIERGDPRDAFLSSQSKTLKDLPPGACVGTSSLRRQSQVLARRPDVKVVPFRGNVDTRLRKLDENKVDATILAVAGLERLGMLGRASSVMDVETMLPGAGQGALGVEIRSGDEEARRLLAPIDDAATSTCVRAERAVLKVLDGSCRTPIAALAKLLPGGRLRLDALVAKKDGSLVVRLQKEGLAADASAIGEDLGRDLKGRAPCDIFA